MAIDLESLKWATNTVIETVDVLDQNGNPTGDSIQVFNKVEPSTQFRDSGLLYEVPLARGFLNTQFNNIYEAFLAVDNANTIFGGELAGQVISQGYANSATTAVFHLPINMTASPSSITVVSTFEVLNASGASEGVGFTPSLDGNSSNKLIKLTISGLSGLIVGEVLTLNCQTDTSQITVVA